MNKPGAVQQINNACLATRRERLDAIEKPVAFQQVYCEIRRRATPNNSPHTSATRLTSRNAAGISVRGMAHRPGVHNNVKMIVGERQLAQVAEKVDWFERHWRVRVGRSARFETVGVVAKFTKRPNFLARPRAEHEHSRFWTRIQAMRNPTLRPSPPKRIVIPTTFRRRRKSGVP